MANKYIERFSSPTPKFWKDVQKKALFLSGLCLVLMAGEVEVNGNAIAFELPKLMQNILSFVCTISGVVAFVAQFTIENSADTDV